MTTMHTDELLKNAIKNAGIDVILSVPCSMLKGLIELLEDDPEITFIPVTREEEAVGIAAGVHLGGRKALVLMQNSGLGNSINGIKSLLEVYQIPVVLMMSHRGLEGEKISAQIPMGELTLELLSCIGVESLVINSHIKIINFEKAVKKGDETNKPIAVVLQRSLWGDS